MLGGIEVICYVSRDRPRKEFPDVWLFLYETFFYVLILETSLCYFSSKAEECEIVEDYIQQQLVLFPSGVTNFTSFIHKSKPEQLNEFNVNVHDNT